MKTLPIDDHSQGIFSHKLGHFFPIFEKGQGRPPPSPLLLRACENSIYSVYDPLAIKLLHRLQLGFGQLCEHKFGHNFADTVNPLRSCYL